ncbi:NAD(P)/FAD-dependent oxidoreductase [Desmospora profundinema]|uniref:Aerobic glycerol-3-phosphate dehydrogenase n=1 Tax=Desmospora profundinema TaxID=1571184 RepID=A0ABU1IJF5_9BACL|nr:FAD-dependent oxidoreductase [Desmospora profundinema]MDR6224912.1 sarcosine oxidase subunit beta [Desmospora profundinema]
MNDIRHTEVLVIGGGVIGGAIAYYVSKSGLEVTVLEKGDLASGTSSKCDGNILAIDKDPGFDSQMSLKSQQLVKQLSKDLELPFEYRAPGSMLVCESEEEMAAAKKWVDQQKKAGLSFRMLDREDLQQESPYFADDLLGGLECHTDATVNPYLLTYALFHGAEKQGAKRHVHTEVTRIQQDATGMFHIFTSRGRFTAKKVINAAGVWAPLIGAMVGVKIPIQPRKGHMVVAARHEPVGLRKVMEFGYLLSKFGGHRKVDAETKRYGVALVFEPTESQNFLIGSSRQFAGFDTRVDIRVIRSIARRAIRFYPKMADMLTIRTYAGLRPWTEDHLPIISEVDEVPGFYIAAGHEGDGISLAAVTGKLMEELIRGEAETSIPTEPLRYNRFQRKDATR